MGNSVLQVQLYEKSTINIKIRKQQYNTEPVTVKVCAVHIRTGNII